MTQATDTDITELKNLIVGISTEIKNVKDLVIDLDKKVTVMDTRLVEVEKKIDKQDTRLWAFVGVLFTIQVSPVKPVFPKSKTQSPTEYPWAPEVVNTPADDTPDTTTAVSVTYAPFTLIRI